VVPVGEVALEQTQEYGLKFSKDQRSTQPESIFQSSRFEWFFFERSDFNSWPRVQKLLDPLLVPFYRALSVGNGLSITEQMELAARYEKKREILDGILLGANDALSVLGYIPH
jgi:hypothetical protein